MTGSSGGAYAAHHVCIAGRREELSSPQIGVFDLFKVGLGPSSSHTMGPMSAAADFIGSLDDSTCARVVRVVATAFGSLAWTGRGHATDKALAIGLSGHRPDNLAPDDAVRILDELREHRQLRLPSGKAIAFVFDRDIVFDTERKFDRHPNAMEFLAFDGADRVIESRVVYSIGGGFTEVEGQTPDHARQQCLVRFKFRSSQELLDLCRENSCKIADVALANEIAKTNASDVVRKLDRIVDVMMACIDRGITQSGTLPGNLRVKRRAQGLYARLQDAQLRNSRSPSEPFDYISAFAIAVNEENAAGGRMVTAPTNGAAGVVPAVLRYYRDFCEGSDRKGMRTFLLVAGAIGSIIKQNASISGAEVGCQGEVGSAAAMASAGLTAVLGGSNEQIENAAEIAMEHHLGMTCDPVGGLVQIPCIERNAFGAVKAVNASYLAMAGDGAHHVSLDQVIETMRQTGHDMLDKYRETSRGGLALNVPEC